MKKKVCHISYNHDAFDDRIYWKELLTLQEAGYETVHLCVANEENDFFTAEGVRIIQVKRRPPADNIWMNRLLQVAFRKKGTIDALLAKAAGLAADVYHYHDLQINALVEKLKKLPHRPKVIYDVHEIYWLLVKNERTPNFFKYPYLYIYSAAIKQWELRQAAWCDHVIAVVPFLAQHFKKNLPQVPQTTICNYSFFKPELPYPKREYDLIYPGDISKTRGVEEIIHACAALKAVFPALKCLLIGAVEDRQKTEAMIVACGVTENVLLHEPVTFEAMRQFYRQSRIGLGLYHATAHYIYALPIKLFEYMAFGLPVVFTDAGLAAAIISKENCGLLVDVHRIESVVAAIRKLLSDPEQYALQSENGQRAVMRHSWDNEKEKLLAVYHSLLNPCHQHVPPHPARQ